LGADIRSEVRGSVVIAAGTVSTKWGTPNKVKVK
jgi:hypothetical protein